MMEVKRHVGGVKLFLIGDGPLRQQLEQLAARLGIADSVVFVGSRSQECLPDWYRAADLTVLSSWSEGMPNVLRESLACGTPFVSTKVGGIQEIEGVPAECLVPPGESAAMAAAICAALANPAPMAIHGFPTWEESAEALVGLLGRRVESETQFHAATAV